MNRPLFASGVVLILAAFGCDTPVNTGPPREYTIEQRLECFCPNGGEWVSLRIFDDEIVSAVRLSDLSSIPLERWEAYKTIGQLFRIISTTDTSLFTLRFEIDPIQNIPTYVFLEPKPIIRGDTVLIPIDAGVAYVTRDYRPRL